MKTTIIAAMLLMSAPALADVLLDGRWAGTGTVRSGSAISCPDADVSLSVRGKEIEGTASAGTMASSIRGIANSEQDIVMNFKEWELNAMSTRQQDGVMTFLLNGRRCSYDVTLRKVSSRE